MVTQNQTQQKTKKSYTTPKLINFGNVRTLTQAGTQGLPEGGSGRPDKKPSDRITKQNIVRIGDHPFGIGLYLFDYRPEYREEYGHGRQFGMMADEVETVMPEAVSIHPDGYKIVNYGMLGISHSIH
jgi:hypothetical protein